jgi:hypothetical protein
VATDEVEQSPFTKPGFIAAAVVVAIVVVLGVVAIVMAVTRDGSPAAAVPTAAPSATAAPTTRPPSNASACGLDGVVLSGSLSTAPAAEWAFQGTTAYPTSTAFGPAETDADGVRHCFQHSPSGALFAAANAVVQGSDAGLQEAFARYFIATGPGREVAISNAASGTASTGRTEIVGFRLLNKYEGPTATIDIAVRATANGQTIYGSGVYPLKWEDGDWKLTVTDTGELQYPFTQIPDLAGYISWGK